MTIINAVKKERKGKERKGKGLLYLIAIAVLISLVFISCGDKPTGMADFETDVIDIPNQSNPSDKPSTETPGTGQNAITQDDIDKLGNKTSGELASSGYYFESANYQNGNSGTFTYKVQVLKMPDGAGKQFNALKFKGFDANGKEFTRIYDMGSPQKYNTDNRYFIPQPYSGATGSINATFYNGGKLTLQFNNSSGSATTIELALKKKSTTDLIV